MLGTTAAAILLTSVALTGTAHADSTPVGTGPALGAVVDPDQQYADFLANRRPDGSWAGAAEPGDKATAPPTQLDAYPKYTERQLAEMKARAPKAATGDAATQATVQSVRATPQGTEVTTYLPAPGVTAEQLAGNLRARGLQDVRLVRPAADRDAARKAPGDCAYGSARTLSCPVVYWRNNGFEDPRVRFNDHSGASWPVSNAVPKWNRVANIDSWYAFNSCPSMPGARCVDVFSGNYGDIGWVGLATLSYPAGGGAISESGARIQLNDYYNPAERGFTRNNVATHEVGHILGLGHNVYSGDVLYRIANRREDIGGENPVLLAGLYSVGR